MISQSDYTRTGLISEPIVRFSSIAPLRPREDPVFTALDAEATHNRNRTLASIEYCSQTTSQKNERYFRACCLRNFDALTTFFERLDREWAQQRDQQLLATVTGSASATASASAPLASTSTRPVTGTSTEMVDGASSSVFAHCRSPPSTPLDAQNDADTGSAPLAVGEPVTLILETSSRKTTSTASNVEVDVTVAHSPTAQSSVATAQVAGTSESSRDSDRDDECSASSPKRARTSPDASSPN